MKSNYTKIKVGDMFGRWLVLEIDTINPQSKAKNPPKMALCECQCAKKTRRYKEYRDLYSGRSKSCGCLRGGEALSQKNVERSSVKVGNVYGYLTVEEYLGFRTQSRGKRESWYRCSCSNCGKMDYEVNGNNLQSGAVISCGCVSSKGEATIRDIFNKNNINFSQQYTFPDLKSENGYLLKFDFAVFNNEQLAFLIEFDGRQHYEGPEAKWTTTSKEQIQYRDSLKNNFCKEKGIKLKRIPYFELKNLTIENLLDDTYTYI